VNTGTKIALANIPTMLCAIIGGLLADRGHTGFAVAFLVLAFMLGHTVRGEDN
jgi:hypothetical protein